MLVWALDSTGLPEAELEKRFPKLSQWHSGEARPTLKQARELAKLARIPFGRLLLDEPSGERVGVTDFRTVGNKAMGTVSADLRETIRSSQSRLAWYADFAAEEGIAPPTMYASATVEHDPGETAERTRELLGIERGKPLPGSDNVAELAAAMEEDGILVARNSIVGNTTSRRLSVGEFRGFTIEDGGYVLAFVNTADAKTAQLFSLAHELGHVVLGCTGISDHSEHADVERWCNRFAAAVIAPAEAVELAFTSREEPMNAAGLYEAHPADQHESGGAPRFNTVVRSRVGSRFFDSITHAWSNGQISDRDAARHLGVSTYAALSKLANA
ncbi:ImmA/IrrE family metallo-endopeptidase [Corynebacterium lehmanniae]|nr:ImmA/IrrE family metallo-endopeptidase [Corynebacterium lehmanniae]